MKNSILIKSFALSLLLSPAAFAVNDNVTSTVYNTPQAGSLTSNQEANNNSASNNGMIGTSSSATANKLDSSITAVTRQDISNQQFGNSSIGNTSNNSAGGYSGGNTLSNTANGGAGGYATSNSGNNSLSNSQSQGQSSNNANSNSTTTSSSGNTTTVTGGNTTVQRSAPSLGGNVSFQQVGTTGFNLGATSIFGGGQIGFNKTNKDAKAFMRAQVEETYQRANTIYTDNVITACSVVSEEQCLELKERLMNRLQ